MGMHLVYVTRTGRHFHSDPECRRIRCGQRANSSSPGATAVPLGELENISPCLSCYPDAPRAKTFHQYCHQCSSEKPCEHNGGVLVEVPRTWKTGSSLLLSAGERTVARRYVWPERAHWYSPVASE